MFFNFSFCYISINPKNINYLIYILWLFSKKVILEKTHLNKLLTEHLNILHTFSCVSSLIK
jgi:hypothetical protein